ncbi:hypothetical protein ATX28_09160 [Oenococcus oeni]|uniref:nSTAND3 domain-containing NTPase n=1 Tax=Oenococcus oeni TaxID=1247 RepID=UPI000953114A|nr:hypothetical protein [Oenococcus oeni]OLQ38373.1 hypothetical protein ATX28_09160 [Oenococcus oeni]
MSKLSDIENHVNRLSGSAFQILCDTYLKKSHFSKFEYHSYGRKTGEDKTIKGNPDTYFIDQNGQYIFVMYTTIKKNLLSKLTEDVNKCFDIKKNGNTPVDRISEIVYCYTDGRISAGDRDILGNICLQHDTLFKMLSTAEISQDLFDNYSSIVRDQLGISIGTGQITDAKTFIKKHDANKLSAPLNNSFLFRENELKQISLSFDNHQPVIITGPAGTGKTKLALEASKRYCISHKDYKLFCIRSKNLDARDFFDDLASSTESNDNYLFFIDDANEFQETHLNFVLDYLIEHTNSRLIVTVRNYVLKKVKKEIQKYQQPSLIRPVSFSRDQIGQLIDSAYHINQQSEFVDYVYSTYNGNPRLAMFASKLMLQKENFLDIHNTSELYDRYYQDSIEEILSVSSSAPISAGIISFLKNISLGHLDILNDLFACFNLSQADFLNDLRKFESLELVEIHRGKSDDTLNGAKISDESFSDYLVKYLFIDQKRLALDKMIELSFFKLKDRTIVACSALRRIFLDPQTISYLERVINQIWDKLESVREKDKESEKRFEAFFDAFFALRPIETLLELQESVNASQTVTFDASSIDFKNKVHNETINDKIIEKLGVFAGSPYEKDAIDLALEYFKKRSDLLMEFYFLFTKRFGINNLSSKHDFKTQKLVIKRLKELTTKDLISNNIFLAIKVFTYYLGFTYESIEADAVNNNSISIWTSEITEGSNVREIRNQIWDFLLYMYQASSKNHSEIEEILYNYGNRFPSKSKDVIENDYQRFCVFFQNLFDPDCLYQCVLAENIHQILNEAKIEDKGYLDKFLNSKKYKIFNQLSKNNFREPDLNWQQAQLLRKQQISKLVANYSYSDIKQLFIICKEADNSLSQREKGFFYDGLNIFFDVLSKKKTVFVQTAKLYLQNNTPGHLNPSEIIQQLFTHQSVSDVWTLIETAGYDDKSLWEATFYAELPEDKINQSYLNQLLTFYSDPHNYPSRPRSRIYFLDKYQKINSDIYPIFYKQILKNYEANPRGAVNILSAVFDIVHLDHSSIDTVINNFTDDINILEEAYLKCLDQSNQNSMFDYQGKFFIKLIQVDSDFLDNFLFHLTDVKEHNRKWIFIKNIYFDHFDLIWNLPDYYDHFENICHWVLHNIKYSFERSDTLKNIFTTGSASSTAHQEKQIKFVRESLDRYQDAKEKDFILLLFSLTEILPSKDRINLIMGFEQKNSDFNIFSQIPLQRMSFSGTSDQIISQGLASITFLKNLEARMNGITFLKHKKFIEKLINAQKREIDAEDLEEFIEN